MQKIAKPLVPCDSIASKQTAVVGGALLDRPTSNDGINDWKDSEIRNKEVIPTVDLSYQRK